MIIIILPIILLLLLLTFFLYIQKKKVMSLQQQIGDLQNKIRFLYKGIIINHNKNRANLH